MRNSRGTRNRGPGFQNFLEKYIIALTIILCIVVFMLVRDEVKTSKYQSHYLSAISKQLSFKLAAGSNASVRYPEYGPYDQRLGYTS